MIRPSEARLRLEELELAPASGVLPLVGSQGATWNARRGGRTVERMAPDCPDLLRAT